MDVLKSRARGTHISSKHPLTHPFRNVHTKEYSQFERAIESGGSIHRYLATCQCRNHHSFWINCTSSSSSENKKASIEDTSLVYYFELPTFKMRIGNWMNEIRQPEIWSDLFLFIFMKISLRRNWPSEINKRINFKSSKVRKNFLLTKWIIGTVKLICFLVLSSPVPISKM